MINAVFRSLDTILGRGEAAVTVPPLDGALRPNRKLDEAALRLPLPGVDSLSAVGGRLYASSGLKLFALDEAGQWTTHHIAPAEIACLADVGGGLALGLADGEIVVVGGKHDGRRYRAGNGLNCLTAMTAAADALYVANGSDRYGAADWQVDLLDRNASGTIWRVPLDGGASGRIAGGLAFPAGLVADGDSLVVSEAWKHRLIRLNRANGARSAILDADLPGYPGRLARGASGCWLALFAPRSQLVEFVLREPGYRNRMIASVPRPYWVAPKLRSGRSFYEPLQGGGVKHLGMLKPWAPAMSFGLCVRLDSGFQPVTSFHSRADGVTHGVTSVIELGKKVFVAARGDDVVVALDGDVA